MSRDSNSIFRFGIPDFKETVDIFQKKEPKLIVKEEPHIEEDKPITKSKKEKPEKKVKKVSKEPIVRNNILQLLQTYNS
jgi:hypothetical protein